ncbi:MAG: endolytic transglycosylase MltG [Candidatus Aminicenantaceae bacterium]
MIIRIAKTAVMVTIILILFVSYWLGLEFHSVTLISPENKYFEVKKGNTINIIAQNLKKNGFIKKKYLLVLEYKLFFHSETIKAGKYAFSSPTSIRNILMTMIEGKVYFRPITIPEGLTRKEIAQLLESKHSINKTEFLKASSNTDLIKELDKSAENLEGYLFPETYHFQKDVTAETIVSSMISQFKSIFNNNWKKRAEEINMNIREVVILASIIEKETSLPQEKKIVSGVFHNRLKMNMKLDCDPTIIYILKEQGVFKGDLRYKHMDINSPYNTYLYPGIPPGPICNPGKTSLEASLYPEDRGYLYFVSKNDGSHHFSRTFKEHQRAVRKYQTRK